MPALEPSVRIDATRFTVTPALDVPDVHNVQVQVEQRRDGRWVTEFQGQWLDRTGVPRHACGANAEHCSHDFTTALRLAVEAAEQIVGMHRHD